MTDQQQVLIELIRIVKQNSFGTSSKTILEQRTVTLHRRGVLIIPTQDGQYIGRALFGAKDPLTGNYQVHSLNVSISWEIQRALEVDGKLLCKGSQLHETDLAVRGMSLRIAEGQRGQLFLIGEANQIADQHGAITPYEVTHAWRAELAHGTLTETPTVTNGRVVRRQVQTTELQIFDYGEMQETYSTRVDNKVIGVPGGVVSSTVQMTEKVMLHRYSMGVYSSMSETILRSRLNHLGQVMMEVAEYREEKLSMKQVETIIEQSVEIHLKKREEVIL